MRFAKMTFLLGLGLFVAAGMGLAGTWALAASTVVMGLATLVAVVVMEERDYANIEGLYPAANEPLEPELIDADAGALAHAA